MITARDMDVLIKKCMGASDGLDLSPRDDERRN